MGSISPQKRNGTVVGYSVYLGVDAEGRRQRKFFARLADAEKLVRVHSADPRPVGELLDRKAEILFCLEQLRPLGVTLPDVVVATPVTVMMVPMSGAPRPTPATEVRKVSGPRMRGIKLSYAK